MWPDLCARQVGHTQASVGACGPGHVAQLLDIGRAGTYAESGQLVSCDCRGMKRARAVGKWLESPLMLACRYMRRLRAFLRVCVQVHTANVGFLCVCVQVHAAAEGWGGLCTMHCAHACVRCAQQRPPQGGPCCRDDRGTIAPHLVRSYCATSHIERALTSRSVAFFFLL